jgi:hypothetical protein
MRTSPTTFEKTHFPLAFRAFHGFIRASQNETNKRRQVDGL